MPDPSTVLLIECVADLLAGQEVLVLGALDGALAVAVAGRVAPGGKLYLADYDQAALDRAEGALKAVGATGAVLLSPDRLGELPSERFDVALLHILPFASSALLVRLLHETGRLVRPGGMLYAGGPRDRGIVAVGKRMEELFGKAGPLRYGKGSRVIAAVRPLSWSVPLPPQATEVITVELRGQRLALELRDGVFARGGLDEGSVMLCNALDLAPDAQLLDLGCGGGLVGMLAARLAPHCHATLVDSNSAAVALATANIARNSIANATALVSDGTAAVADQRFSVVVTNPPFHQGRMQTTDTALRFIREAHQVLAPGGSFYLVCNRFLPYERTVGETFGNVQEVTGNGRYRVLLARADRQD